MSFLIFDIDHSLAAIGGMKNAEKIASMKPIPISNGLNEVKDVISRLFIREEVEFDHPLLNDNLKQTILKLSATAEKYALEGIVIDTISHLFRSDMRILESKNKSERLELFDWGKLERMYNQFIYILTSLPVWVIVNAHITYDKNDLGQFLFYPQLKGSTRDFIGEYFDCILFTKVANSNNKIQYLWQTKPDTQKYAKDRLDVLEPMIPQDFSTIISRYQEKGIQHPKILVIGESGTGKTRAFTTVKNIVPDTPANNGNGKASALVINSISKS